MSEERIRKKRIRNLKNNIMKTNHYIEQYMKMVIDKRRSETKYRRAMKSLSWKSNFPGYENKIHINPEHFNYFNFRVTAKDAILTVDDARKLGKWLLEITEGLGNPFEIDKEIQKRKQNESI